MPIDSHGNECPLEIMCRREPEWAHSRIVTLTSERDAWRQWAAKELGRYHIKEATTASDDRLRDLLAAFLEAHLPEPGPKP